MHDAFVLKGFAFFGFYKNLKGAKLIERHRGFDDLIDFQVRKSGNTWVK